MKMYVELKKIQEMLIEDDDYMSQERLFKLQDYVATLLLKVAEEEGKTKDLVKTFPWMYKIQK